MISNGNMELAVTLRLLDKLTQPMSRALTMGRRETDSMGKSVSALSRISMNGLVNGINLVSRAATAAERAIKGVKAGVSALQTRAQVTAGIGAGAYVMSRPIGRTMDFDLRLANMSNTAFSNLDKTGRQAGMRELNLAVMNAVRGGGGNRDQAAEALDTMIASGVVSNKDAISMLPGIMKAATASDTNASELATIAIRAQQSFKIKPGEIPAVLSAATAAGQAGGFELKDMAKWLPQQMAMASNLGLSGKEGFAKLAAWNQASVITAGTKDEAGNDLRDLLNELNTPHFKGFLAQQVLNNGQKLKPGERNTQLKNIDQLFLNYQANGVDKVSATLDIMSKVFSKDKGYLALQAKLKSTVNNDERRGVLEAMAAQMQGSAIGKVFHNQQSLMSFLGLQNNQEYTKDVLNKTLTQYSVPNGKSATDVGYEVISDTSSYKTNRLTNEKTFAEQDGFGGISQTIGNVASKLADYAQHYPGLTSAIVVATTALTALAAGASAAGLAGLLTRGGGSAAAGAAARAGGGIMGRLGVSAALAGGMPLGELMTVGGATAFGTAAVGVGAAGVAGYGVGTLLNKGMDFGLSKMAGKDSSLGSMIYDLLHHESGPIRIENKLVIDGRQVAESVNQINSRQLRRN
jgi:TP901 family phage tail tape measure protein